MAYTQQCRPSSSGFPSVLEATSAAYRTTSIEDSIYLCYLHENYSACSSYDIKLVPLPATDSDSTPKGSQLLGNKISHAMKKFSNTLKTTLSPKIRTCVRLQSRDLTFLDSEVPVTPHIPIADPWSQILFETFNPPLQECVSLRHRDPHFMDLEV